MKLYHQEHCGIKDILTLFGWTNSHDVTIYMSEEGSMKQLSKGLFTHGHY